MRTSSHKVLSVIIPVYNEEKTIQQLLDKVLHAAVPVSMEVLIVNDGSTDHSAELCREWIQKNQANTPHKFTLLERPNGGKGAAVKTGIAHSAGDAVIIQDADLEYDPNDYAQCIAPILHGECKVVYGSREADNRNRLFSSPSFFLGGLVLTWWIDLLYNAELTDEPTCYKTFDGALLRSLPIEGSHFEWEPEITAKLLRLGYEIREVPISYHPRKVTEGKKIKWFDGLQGLWIALLWRFAPMNQICKNAENISSTHAAIIHTHKNNCKWFWGIFLFALLLRIAAALPGICSGEQNRLIRPDSYSFLYAAGPGIFKELPKIHQPYPAAIQKHKEKTPQWQRVMNSQTRAPLYPFWLSLLFGISGHSLIFAACMGCLLGAMTCGVVCLSGHLFGSPKVGAAAALLLAVNPTAVVYSSLFLPDTLFMLIAALQVWFFLRFTHNTFGLNLIASVVLAAIGALIRPVNALWVIPCIAVLAFYKQLPLRLRFNYMFVAMLIFAAVLLPWMWSAHHAGIGWRIDTVGSDALMKNTAAMESKITGLKTAVIKMDYNRELIRRYSKEPEKFASIGAQLRERDNMMWNKILEHPFRYAASHFNPKILTQDFTAMLISFGIPNQYRKVTVLSLYFFSAAWSVVILLGLAWFFLAGNGRQSLINFLLFLLLGAYYLLMPGAIALPRYQLPALPFICLAAGFGLLYLRCTVKEQKAPSGL